MAKKIFKPRRGKASTMNGTKKSTILAAGEFFVELPDTGVGTGSGKIKMGDGVSTYDKLPYLLGDTSNDIITNIPNNTSTALANALADVTNGKKLVVIIAALKQAITIVNNAISSHNHDSRYSLTSHNHDSRYYTETEVNNLLSAKAASNHNHDSVYRKISDSYSKSEVDNRLNAKAASNHTHSYFSLSGTTLTITF